MGKIALEGAVDPHCHFSPDFILPQHPVQPSVTALQAAQEAVDARMAAIVLKSHDFCTAALAFTLNQVVPGVRTFGGIALDHQAGGLNPWAVEHALRLGAKIVWLPTIAGHQDYLNGIGPALGYPGTGIRTTDESGKLLPVVQQIFDLVAEHDAILATGHITADEHYAVVRAFARRGRVLVTHAGEPAGGPRLTTAQCVDLAQLGAFIELSAQECVPHMGHAPRPYKEMGERIDAIGPQRVVLCSDFGHSNEVPKPAQGLQDFIAGLGNAGVPHATLKVVAADNMARLLGMQG